MKIINNNKKTCIILDDQEELEISTLKKNNEKIIIKCLQSSLLFEEITEQELKNKKMEKESIEAIERYLKERE